MTNRKRVHYEVRWDGTRWIVKADGKIVLKRKLKAAAITRARCIARRAWRRSGVPGELRIFTKSGPHPVNGGATYGRDPEGPRMRRESFVCEDCEAHVENLMDRFDIRIEARRADGNDRPNVVTVAKKCRAHKDDLFALLESGRAFFILDPAKERVVVHVQQDSLL